MTDHNKATLVVIFMLLSIFLESGYRRRFIKVTDEGSQPELAQYRYKCRIFVLRLIYMKRDIKHNSCRAFTTTNKGRSIMNRRYGTQNKV